MQQDLFAASTSLKYMRIHFLISTGTFQKIHIYYCCIYMHIKYAQKWIYYSNHTCCISVHTSPESIWDPKLTYVPGIVTPKKPTSVHQGTELKPPRYGRKGHKIPATPKQCCALVAHDIQRSQSPHPQVQDVEEGESESSPMVSHDADDADADDVRRW